LRLDRVAERRGLLHDSGPAEEDRARQQTRERQTDNGQPQRMRQPDNAAEPVGRGVERDAKQHSGKDQKQGCGEMPGEQQQGRKCDDADAAD
jgi:hypothetical protein